MKQAIFGAGCFWGVQAYFDEVPGVQSSEVGYAGGHTENPTYEQVCMHGTGHAEVTLINYDADQVGYEMLVRHFFRIHDPTQLNRQGPDIGDQYRSIIFYFTEDQKQVAESIRTEVQARYDRPIVTEIVPLPSPGAFYRAEEYHQKYTEKTGMGACHVAYEPLKEQ